MIERTLWNYYLRSHSYFRRRTRCLGFPKIYTVELTNRCAMSCKMCPRKEMTRPIGDMTFETFQKVVAQKVISLPVNSLGSAGLAPFLAGCELPFSHDRHIVPRVETT